MDGEGLLQLQLDNTTHDMDIAWKIGVGGKSTDSLAVKL